MKGLLAIETHPIQYHAPVYQALQRDQGIPTTVIYGSDYGVAGYWDDEFQKKFAWDTDLLAGYQSIFLSRSGGKSGKPSARNLRNKIREVDPKTILLTGYSPLFYSEVVIQALTLPYPLLFRGETTDHARVRSSVKMCARDALLRFIYSRCSRLLYVGKESLSHFKRLGCPETKLVFSPYCVNAQTFQCDEDARRRLRDDLRGSLGFSGDQTVLLFSGKLSRRKGADLLLSAVKQLPELVRKNMGVIYIGSGNLDPELRRLAADSPSTRVHFAGFQNQTKLSPYYHAADLLVLPSLYSETWGLVVNEALHHGLPAVVSDAVGCAPDLIEPGVTGEIFRSGSMTDLCAVLQRALALTHSEVVRTRCREKIQNYTVEKAAAGLASAHKAVG